MVPGHLFYFLFSPPHLRYFVSVSKNHLPAFVAYVEFAEPALSAAVAYVELEAEPPNYYDLALVFFNNWH